MQTTMNRANDTLKHLNSFLRCELSAVEAYRHALMRLNGSAHRSALEECARSHEQRVDLLTREIRRRGGEPASESEAWTPLVTWLEAGAPPSGERAAVAELEEWEDYGSDDYRREAHELDYEARLFLQSKVLPEQARTRDAIVAVKSAMH